MSAEYNFNIMDKLTVLEQYKKDKRTASKNIEDITKEILSFLLIAENYIECLQGEFTTVSNMVNPKVCEYYTTEDHMLCIELTEGAKGNIITLELPLTHVLDKDVMSVTKLKKEIDSLHQQYKVLRYRKSTYKEYIDSNNDKMHHIDAQIKHLKTSLDKYENKIRRDHFESM